MAICLTATASSWVSVAHADELECTAEDDPLVAAADPRWVVGGAGALELEADVPAGFDWELRVQVRLGPLVHAWTEGPFEAETGQLSVAPTIPTQAFLHAHAEDYVSDLTLHVIGTNAAGQRIVFPSPPAFVAWPQGPTAGAVVWDLPMMTSLAPLGVVDPAIRAAKAGAGTDRVLPPIYVVGTPEPDPAPEGD